MSAEPEMSRVFEDAARTPVRDRRSRKERRPRKARGVPAEPVFPPAAATDEVLMHRVKSRDTDAFIELLDRYRKRIVAFLFRSVGDGQAAEDLAQDVFARVYLRAASFDDGFPFSLWLFRIARNLVIDHLRRRSVPGRRWLAPAVTEAGQAEQREDFTFSPDRALERKDLQQAIRSVVSRMPEVYRSVFILRDLHDFSYEDIAAVTGASVKTVSSRLSRARRFFRERIRRFLGT